MLPTTSNMMGALLLLGIASANAVSGASSVSSVLSKHSATSCTNSTTSRSMTTFVKSGTTKVSVTMSPTAKSKSRSTKATGSSKSNSGSTKATGSSKSSSGSTKATGSSKSNSGSTKATGSSKSNSGSTKATGSSKSNSGSTKATGSSKSNSGSTKATGSTKSKSGTTRATGQTTTTATKPMVTSWTTGACTPGTLSVPALTCKSTTATPVTGSGCYCPDKKWYMKLSGDPKGPCNGYIGEQNDLLLAIMTSCPTPTPTATTSTSSTPTYGLATQITVGSPPTICKSADYSYETKMSVSSGWVYIYANSTGWGPEGSVWNITTGSGAELTQVKAQCQGSSCTGITSNSEASGQAKQRSDGSWYMNVTANMQPSLSISGLLLPIGTDKSNSTGKRDLSERASSNSTSKKYPLDVLGVPPCGLPIAKSCNKNWEATPDQWEAYQVDNFMKSYLAKNKLNSFADLRDKALNDFTPPSVTDGKTCDFTNPHFNCIIPSYEDCSGTNDDDLIRGLLLTTAVVEYTNFIALVYSSLATVSGRVGDFIDGVTADFWKPAAAETWTKIMSIISSVIGILIGVFVLLALIPGLEEAAGVTWAVGIAVLASNAFGIAGNVGGLLANPGDSDTLFLQGTDYKIGAQNMIAQTQSGLDILYTNDGVGADTVGKVLGAGSWVGKGISTAFNAPGFAENSTVWYEKLIVAQAITRALTDNQGYILFIPYKGATYNGEAWDFDQDQCEKHWTNDPSWKYAAACDITFGPNGEAGMSVFTRPSSLNSESSSWAETPLNYRGQNITWWDIMSSSVWGQQMHGFNFTFLNQNFTGTLVDEGPSAARAMFDIPMNEPGLYNIPVCHLTDLAYIPGVDQVRSDMDNNAGVGGYYHSDNPCPCSGYSYTSQDGHGGQFTDFVSQTIKDSIGGGCAITGDIRSKDED